MASYLLRADTIYNTKTGEYEAVFHRVYSTMVGRNRAERHYRLLGCSTMTMDILGGGYRLEVTIDKGDFHPAKQKMMKRLKRK